MRLARSTAMSSYSSGAAVERVDRLVDRLLGGEDGAAARDRPRLRAARRRTARFRRPPAAAARRARHRRRARRYPSLRAATATAISASCAIEPTKPCGHSGKPPGARGSGASAGPPSAASASRAARRAAPLARRRASGSEGSGKRRLVAHRDLPDRGAHRRSGELLAASLRRHQQAPRARPTSRAGLPRQREPAGVISPFIRNASGSSRVRSPSVTP